MFFFSFHVVWGCQMGTQSQSAQSFLSVCCVKFDEDLVYLPSNFLAVLRKVAWFFLLCWVVCAILASFSSFVQVLCSWSGRQLFCIDFAFAGMCVDFSLSFGFVFFSLCFVVCCSSLCCNFVPPSTGVVRVCLCTVRGEGESECAMIFLASNDIGRQLVSVCHDRMRSHLGSQPIGNSCSYRNIAQQIQPMYDFFKLFLY